MSRRAAVHRAVPLDLAQPLEAFAPAFPRGRGAFLLDGAGGPEGLARFSLFGGEPVTSLVVRREGERTPSGTARLHVRVTGEGGELLEDGVADDPFATLRALLAERAVPATELAAVPFPFRAGAVGYLGYELGQALERLPGRVRPRGPLPDLALFFHDWVLGRELASGRTWLSVVGRGGDEAEATRAAEAIVRRVTAKLAAAPRLPEPCADAAPLPRSPLEIAALAEALGARPALPRAAYLEAVTRAKRHIEAGDAFEICLTNALEIPWGGDPFTLWRALRSANPSPFAAWLDTPEGAIVSASPERFLSLDAHGSAESRPIKGTRPRGSDPSTDGVLAADLAASEKDRAENAMIVDLVRNDLGRVCRFGSVHVPVLQDIERHPSVHQMVSTVRGVLEEGRDGLDLVRACFPPGSMTGAPKIEAMSLLEALEPVERGVYSGALGFFDDGGALDLSVVIRTAVVRAGQARVSVGGAVVADSTEEAEHDETLVKARALLEALARTRSPAP